MNQQSKSTALSHIKYTVFFGWSILVFAYYFPSLWKGDFSGLLDYFPLRFFLQCGIIDIPLACWVILVTYAIGNFLLQLLPLKSKRKGENIILSFAFGFISISFLTLFLAVIGFLYSFIFYLILIGVTCLSHNRIRELFGLLRKEALQLYNEIKPASILKKAFIIFLLTYFLIFFFINLIHALGPEIGTDPIVYRLFPLRVYADNHTLKNIPEVNGSFSAKNVEMYFLFGYMLHNEITIKVINFIFGIILCYAIYLVSYRYFGRLVGLSASVLFYSIPIVSWHMHPVLVDVGLTFFLFLSIYFVLDWICSNGGRRSLYLSALFCTFAVGIKPYAIITAAALCVLIFWKLYRTDKCSKIRAFIKATSFVVISAIGYLPWALINFSYTKNPFYPLLSKYFGGPFSLVTSASAMKDYKQTITYLPSVGITSLPVVFFKALWGVNFDGNNYDGIVGPFFALLIPVLAIASIRKLDTVIKHILWFTLINFILWFPFIYSTRFMMPLYPALCIATVYIFQSFLTSVSQNKKSLPGVMFRFITVVIISMFAILNIPFFFNSWQYGEKEYTTQCTSFPISYVLGIESKGEYLERFLGSYPVVRFANGLQDAETIFYVGGPATPNFYSKHKMASQSTYYASKFKLINDPDALLNALKEHHISHIMVEKDKGWLIPMIRRTDGIFVNKYLKKIYEMNAFVLYEVLDRKKIFISEYVHHYFLEHMLDATIVKPSKEQVQKSDYVGVFEISSDKRFALKTLPPSKIQFTSTVPENAYLTFSAGKLYPDVGDGGTFTLDLIDLYGKKHNVYRKTLNPRDNYMDVGWHYNEIDLSRFSGQEVDFIFGSDGSNSADEIGDWFCWADPQIVVRPKVLNLIERFSEAKITPTSFENTPNGKPAFPFPFERGGDTRNTITTVATSEISFTVEIPAGNQSLIFGIAMPYQEGDGALAEIFFEADGTTECLYSRYLLPAPNPPSPPFAKGGNMGGLAKEGEEGIDGWIDEIVSLDKFVGKKGRLIFRSSPGPAGDNTADWIGWSEPRIVVNEK